MSTNDELEEPFVKTNTPSKMLNKKSFLTAFVKMNPELTAEMIAYHLTVVTFLNCLNRLTTKRPKNPIQ